MSMGRARARNEKGSLLGVITAATPQMMTMAGRLHFRHLRLGTTPVSSRPTTMIGYMNTAPKITHIRTYRVKYFWGENRGTTPEPPTSISQVRALGNTRMAVATPRPKRTRAELTKGKTYFFSFFFS